MPASDVGGVYAWYCRFCSTDGFWIWMNELMSIAGGARGRGGAEEESEGRKEGRQRLG